MRRTALTVAVAGAASVGLALAPAAAMAAPAVYVYAWEAGELLQYTDLEAGTGDVVPTSEDVFAVTGLDVDSAGQGYAVTYDESRLYSVDVLTGDVADLGALTFGGEQIGDCTGLDYTAGIVSIVCDDVEGQVADSVYLTVDPSTLAVSVVVASDIRVASIATDPADGQLYGFGYDGEIMAVSTGSAVQVGTVVGGDGVLWGADFSADGTLWGTLSDPTIPVTVGDWDFVPAAVTPNGDEDYAENITVYEAAEPAPAPAPQLAATGSDTAPMLFGAVALMAVGAALATAVVVRRRTA